MADSPCKRPPEVISSLLFVWIRDRTLKYRHILNGPCHCACMNALGDESEQIQSRALAVTRAVKETCQVVKAPRSLLIGRSNHPHRWFLPLLMSKWFYFFPPESPSWVSSWSNKPSANPIANELAKHSHSPSSATAKTQMSIPGWHVPQHHKICWSCCNWRWKGKKQHGHFSSGVLVPPLAALIELTVIFQHLIKSEGTRPEIITWE